MFCPRGARRASWSRVMISPPALRILARALSVTRNAHTWTDIQPSHFTPTHLHADTEWVWHITSRDSHLELWQVEDANIIGNGSHDNSNLVFAVTTLHLPHLQPMDNMTDIRAVHATTNTYHSGKGHGRAMDPAHVQSLQHHSVERSVHATREESVQLETVSSYQHVTIGRFLPRLTFTSNLMYGSSDLGSRLTDFFTLWLMSIPYKHG